MGQRRKCRSLRNATRTPPLAPHTVLWSEKPIASPAAKNETPSRVRDSKPPPPTMPATVVLRGRDERQAGAEQHRVDRRVARTLEVDRADVHAGEQQVGANRRCAHELELAALLDVLDAAN